MVRALSRLQIATLVVAVACSNDITGPENTPDRPETLGLDDFIFRPNVGPEMPAQFGRLWLPAGKVPVAQVALSVGQGEIVNADITDERAFGLPGGPITTRGDVIRGDTSGNPERLAVGTADQVLTTDGADVRWGPAPGFAAGTKMLFQQTAAPTGWTKDTTHNNKALRVVTGTAGSGGATAFTSVFGTGKTTQPHTLSTGEMPSHNHNLDIKESLTSGGTIGAGGGPDTADATTGNRGGGGGHSHDLTNFDLQFVDVIIATKD